jgi:hypothetical protein
MNEGDIAVMVWSGLIESINVGTFSYKCCFPVVNDCGTVQEESLPALYGKGKVCIVW